MAKDTRWDQNLSVASDAEGLIGHAGAVLLRKLADQCGLTSALGAALGRRGRFPLIDRGMALVSMAVAIALGAASMSDISVLAHQEPVFGAAPSDTTVRRTLELADPRTLDKIARARAAVRAHVWQLICATPAGFPWLAIAGKLLAGWLVIDLDATLITARSDKEGAAPTFKSGYSCVRCPLLRVDPAQRARLEGIRDNLTARIGEAEREGWAGEAEGLKISLDAARQKLAQLDQLARRAATVHLGMPGPADTAGRILTALARPSPPAEPS